MALVVKTEDEVTSTRTIITDVPIAGQDNLQILVTLGTPLPPNLQDGGLNETLVLEEELNDGGLNDELVSSTILEDPN